MAFALRDADLTAVNSLTKYPSIPTFHTLDPANGTDHPAGRRGTTLITSRFDQ